MIKAIQFVVQDLERSVRFFCDVLQFTFIEETDEKGKEFEKLYQHDHFQAKKALLKLDKNQIELLQFISNPGNVFPKNSVSTDLWFQHIAIVVSNMEKAYDRLQEHQVTPISVSPQTIPEWNIPAAGIKAFYFRSPEFHPLELIYFPEDKGKKEWHNQDSLFLGIDHTAIAISDSERSLAFYKKAGFSVSGETINHGETQEQLTGIEHAKVRIIGLQINNHEGIGLEFLHYLQGGPGRRETYAPNDLVATKSVVACRKLDDLLACFPSNVILSRTAGLALLRDPDGHYLLLKELQI